jgi:protein phosphatase
MIRAGNEDSFHAAADPTGGIFIVADGMGGHAAGEVASEMAVQILRDQLEKLRDLHDRSAEERVSNALRSANIAIFNRTVTEVDKQGMGTTASALILANRRYLIGQVGDSRVYLLRDGVLKQVTKDHSYVQEQVDAGFLTPEQARYHPYSNVITRCVGASDDVDPDTFAGEVREGDVFLVASDGLTGMVDDRRLQQLLLARAEPQRIVDSLIAEANGRGGLDNITAIVVSVRALDADPYTVERTVESPVYRG